MTYILTQEYLDKLQENKEIVGVFLANSLQQGFIYHTLTQGDVDDAYKIQIVWHYNNPLDINKLKEAWECAQQKYPTLRLRFAWEEELLQIVDKDGSLDWRYFDLSNETATRQEQMINQIKGDDRAEPYQLDHGNLFRIYLIKQQENLYTCIFSYHDIILDGWSFPILFSYVHDSYLKLKSNHLVSDLPDKSYLVAQQYLQKHYEDNQKYWDEYTSQIETQNDLRAFLLQTIQSNSSDISERRHVQVPEHISLSIKDDLYHRLKKLSQDEGVTLNAIFEYVWHKVLSLYGNSEQTIVGTTVSGRNLPVDNIESSVGLFINTLPLIVNHKVYENEPVIQVIRNVQENINELNSRSNVNLAKLQKKGKRLFDNLYVYENYPSHLNKAQQSELNIQFVELVDKLDYPLGVMVREVGNKIDFKIIYAAELFDRNILENCLEVFKNLLNEIVTNPYQSVKALNYLNPNQRECILKEWNQTDKNYPSHQTIAGLFEKQAKETPNNTAIVYEDNRLSYKELNERSNQLANYLRSHYDIRPDTLIGLYLDRNETMLICMLGVLKAGAAYVPIDPNYPDERLLYILQDTNSQVMLTHEIHKKKLEKIGGINDSLAIIPIDQRSTEQQIAAQSTPNLDIPISGDDLAYVIYTSGTTGNPKGVMIEHRGVVNLAIAQGQELELANANPIKKLLVVF